MGNESIRNLPVVHDENRKGYEELLREIDVSSADKKKHLRDSIKSVVTGAIVENIPILKDFLEIHNEYNRNIEQQKHIAVLNELFNKVENLEETKEKLLNMLTENQYGLVLFNKYKRISESMPFVEEGIKILANTLKTLVDDDFREKFSEHNYFLELIDKLSVQALILLIDHENWPEQLDLVPSGRYVLGQAIVEDWYNLFALEYIEKNRKNIDSQLLELAVRELYSNGLFIVYQDGGRHTAVLTVPAASLLSYLSDE